MKVGDKVLIVPLGEEGVIAWDWMNLMGVPRWDDNNRYGRWQVRYGRPTTSRPFHERQLRIIE